MRIALFALASATLLVSAIPALSQGDWKVRNTFHVGGEGGGRNPQMLVAMDSRFGAVVASLPIGAGVDATKIDGGLAFAGTGDGNLTAAGMQGGKWTDLQSVKTVTGARTMDVDATARKVFLPTAELESVPSGRPQAKPGAFMIVQVAK